MKTSYVILCLVLGLTWGCALELPRETEFELEERAAQAADSGGGLAFGGEGEESTADDAGGLWTLLDVGGQRAAADGGAGDAPSIVEADGGGVAEEDDGGLDDDNPFAAFSDDLVAYWSFDDDGGERALDRSVNGHHGQIHPDIAWLTQGKRNGAHYFDGERYVDAGAFDVPGHGLTLAAWVYLDDPNPSAAYRVISKTAGTDNEDHYWMLSIKVRSGKPRLRFRLRTRDEHGEQTTCLDGTEAVPSGRWIHAAATYDGERMSVYLDGYLTGQTFTIGSIAEAEEVGVVIGAHPGPAAGWVGALDEVAVLARGLRPDQVCRLAEGDESRCSDLGWPSE